MLIRVAASSLIKIGRFSEWGAITTEALMIDDVCFTYKQYNDLRNKVLRHSDACSKCFYCCVDMQHEVQLF